MKRAFLIGIAVVALGASVMVKAQSPRSAEVQMKAAQQKAEVEGDLKGAIEDYKKVVAAAGNNRALAARALVRMAECYQRLGDAESTRIYERIASEFADQIEQVALARARLGRAVRTESQGGITLRKVWSTRDVDMFGSISPDGRHLSFGLSYMEPTPGRLAVRDLVDGSSRFLASESDMNTLGSVISKDGAMVAWSGDAPESSNRQDLRVASLRGTGVPSFRTLLNREDVQWPEPLDWSPDGQSIAVTLHRGDRTAQIGLVSAQDGSLRVLKSLDWRSPNRAFFSPSGRDLAFDLPVAATEDQRDIFVLAVDGSREMPAVVHPSRDITMGWSPDGRHLLFASDRNGSMGLWALPFKGGRPEGAPVLLKATIESTLSLGVTRNGVMYLGNHVDDLDIEVSSLDLTTGKQAGPPSRPVQAFAGSNRSPMWSRDGRSLLYLSERPTGLVAVIRSIDTGDVREVKPKVDYLNSISLAPDGRSFAVAGNVQGRRGVYLVDAHTGDATPVVITPPGDTFITYGPQWSPDGGRLYYRRNLRPGRAFLERDLASGQEREILRGNLGAVSLSPDGRWIATTDQWESEAFSTLFTVAVETGERRELLRTNSPQHFDASSPQWTPDGRALIVRKMLTNRGSSSEIWLVPTSGAPPRKLDLDGTRMDWGGVRMHPDGKRVAYVSGDRTQEVWVLENFLPASTAKR